MIKLFRTIQDDVLWRVISIKIFKRKIFSTKQFLLIIIHVFSSNQNNHSFEAKLQGVFRFFASEEIVRLVGVSEFHFCSTRCRVVCLSIDQPTRTCAHLFELPTIQEARPISDCWNGESSKGRLTDRLV